MLHSRRPPTPQRLRGRKTYRRLFTEGRPIRAGFLRGFYQLRENSTGGIVTGFAVTRGIRRATARNRVKRILKETWRGIAPSVQEQCLKNRTTVELVILYTGGYEPGKQGTATIAASVARLVKRLTTRIQHKL
jgi:ribonuclease P protein component